MPDFTHPPLLPPFEPGGIEPDHEPRCYIGEVAARTGATPRAIRFYEEKGLIEPAPREHGEFRLYSEADIGRVILIRKLQNVLGSSLDDIKALIVEEELRAHLRAQRDPERPPEVAKVGVQQAMGALARQLAVIEPKIRELTKMREDVLERMEMGEMRLRELDEVIARRKSERVRDDADPDGRSTQG